MDYITLRALFRKPKASIDFIKIEIPQSLYESNALCREFERVIKGRIQLPKGKVKDWITIHDPKTSDLQWLLDNLPEAKILAIEVAIDFTLQDGSNNPDQLEALHEWLKTRLFPQRHATMEAVGKRKYYDARSGKIQPDTLATKSGNETVYWTNPKGYEQVRLYIKTLDNNEPLKGQHSVRIEPTLFGGGSQNAGLYRVAELPQFAEMLRRYLSKFVYVAKGIKPVLKRSRANDPEKATKALYAAAKEQRRVDRAWQQKGAAWAAKHQYDTIPDADTNRLIGTALKSLRDDVCKLKLTRKVAKHTGYEVHQSPVITGDVQSLNPLCIEGTLSVSQQYDGTTSEEINEHELSEIEATAPKGKDYPEKLGFQSELGKSYVRR